MLASVSAEPVCLVIICPHCQCRIRRAEPLERRTSGRCPACNRKIWIDPFQQLFPGRVCLTNEEATHVDFLMRLCDLSCGQPIVMRLRELRQELAAQAGTAPLPATVVNAAFRLASEQCIDPDEEQRLKELRRGYRSFLRRGPASDDHPSADGRTHR